MDNYGAATQHDMIFTSVDIEPGITKPRVKDKSDTKKTPTDRTRTRTHLIKISLILSVDDIGRVKSYLRFDRT